MSNRVKHPLEDLLREPGVSTDFTPDGERLVCLNMSFGAEGSCLE